MLPKWRHLVTASASFVYFWSALCLNQHSWTLLFEFMTIFCQLLGRFLKCGTRVMAARAKLQKDAFYSFIDNHQHLWLFTTHTSFTCCCGLELWSLTICMCKYNGFSNLNYAGYSANYEYFLTKYYLREAERMPYFNFCNLRCRQRWSQSRASCTMFHVSFS